MLDPLQFAYRAGRGVEDATLTLLNLIYKHIEGSKTHARVLFVDFSSAFNTIQPHILTSKLLSHFNIHPKVVGWVLDFLTGRSQHVRVNGTFSDVCISSTGSPQGCVLSPLLYILYTDDCRSRHDERFIIKFADDSAIVSLLQDHEINHGPVVDDFVKWCKSSFLELNIDKTKDMCIDFRRDAPQIDVTIINGNEVEVVEKYKHLGSMLDNKLRWEDNINMILSKWQQRLFFLRKLNYFKVDRKMLVLFYRSCIESVLSFSLTCWFGNLTVQCKNKLGKIVNICSKIIGVQQTSLSTLYKNQVLNKANSIVRNHHHPLYQEFKLLPSCRRYRVPRTRTNRSKHSFIPTAVSVLNQKRND